MSKYKPDDIITPVEASKESEIAYLTISRAIKAGKIPSKKEKNIISLVFKDFEKWWREYQDEQNLIAEKINKEQLKEMRELHEQQSKINNFFGYKRSLLDCFRNLYPTCEERAAIFAKREAKRAKEETSVD